MYNGKEVLSYFAGIETSLVALAMLREQRNGSMTAGQWFSMQQSKNRLIAEGNQAVKMLKISGFRHDCFRMEQDHLYSLLTRAQIHLNTPEIKAMLKEYNHDTAKINAKINAATSQLQEYRQAVDAHEQMLAGYPGSPNVERIERMLAFEYEARKNFAANYLRTTIDKLRQLPQYRNIDKDARATNYMAAQLALATVFAFDAPKKLVGG